MIQRIFLLFGVLSCVFLYGCFDSQNLAEHSFGKLEHKDSKASGADVISMGRDDDDGSALKWHIGGGLD